MPSRKICCLSEPKKAGVTPALSYDPVFTIYRWEPENCIVSAFVWEAVEGCFDDAMYALVPQAPTIAEAGRFRLYGILKVLPLIYCTYWEELLSMSGFNEY